MANLQKIRPRAGGGLFVAGLIGLLPTVLAAAPSVSATETVYYDKHIRPIFKTHCFRCHGEGGELKGGLDLRMHRLILKGGKKGAVVLPGKRSESRLFEFVKAGKMPPEKERLPAADVELIGRWLDGGAKTLRPEPVDLDPDDYITDVERNFWSFRPIGKPAVPAVKGARKMSNPIDGFILARLQKAGLDFSPEADRRTAIRRAYFDLTGLPPTPEELDSALNISHSDLVERLLASPHYGERWGRHWLDIAGYADSEGYTEADTERGWAWRYRDYVIRAWNDDMPFDQFIREQLAGDEMVPFPHKNLPPEKIARLTATGFLRMAPDGTGSGGIDHGLARNQVVAETVQIVSTALLGLTVDCARCHNHRYDPISQRDYYRMRAIFEPALDPKSWLAPNSRRISLYTDADRKVAAEIEAKAKVVDAERNKKIEFFIDRTLQWKLKAAPENLRDALGKAYKTVEKERSEEQKKLLKAHPSVRNISAGSLYLYDREYRVESARLKRERDTRLKELLTEARKQNPEKKIEEKNLAEFNKDGVAELKRLDEGIQYYLDTMSEKVLKAMAAKAKEIRDLKPEEQFIRALAESPGKLPTTHVFHRGDHEQPKDKVAPGELSVVSLPKNPIVENDKALPTTGRRTAFAKRLTDGSHPLTARVIVNRIWMHHFGQGLVRSPGDFGQLGDRPTHPELLDWLARDFMANGWKMKRLHKLIMTSAVWRQASRRTDKLDQLDPDNYLLGRMNVRRLEAESIRDSILAVSGALNRELFGKPVPVMEDEVGQFIIGKENLDGERKPGKSQDLKGQEFRRSIYVQVRRSRILSMFNTFDAPDMEPNCTQRSISTVAPQALVFMNNDFAIQHAGRMAERVRGMAKDDVPRQLSAAWEITFAREITSDEARRSLAFVEKQTREFRERKDKQPELTALANFCQALLGSNEFLYVD